MSRSDMHEERKYLSAARLEDLMVADMLRHGAPDAHHRSNHSTHACSTLARAFSRVAEMLKLAVAAVALPPVMMLVSCGELLLLRNFICGLDRRGLGGRVRPHLLIWSADACTSTAVAQLMPELRQIEVHTALTAAEVTGADDAAQRLPAAFGSREYSTFAVIKAFMPFAAASLGIPSVTQDAGIGMELELEMEWDHPRIGGSPFPGR